MTLSPVHSFDRSVFTQGFGTVNYGSDDGLYVRFFYNAEKDVEATKKNGHLTHKQVEYVEIHHAGGKDVTVRKVRDQDRERFPRQYEGFLANSEKPEDGMPLEDWPAIDVATVADLKTRKIYTVEQLANIHDGALGQLGIPIARELQKKAKVYLDAARGHAVEQALADENAKLHNEIDNMKLQFAEELKSLKAAIAEGKAPTQVSTTNEQPLKRKKRSPTEG